MRFHPLAAAAIAALIAASLPLIAQIPGGAGCGVNGTPNCNVSLAGGSGATVNQGTQNAGGAAAWWIQSGDGAVVTLGAKADAASSSTDTTPITAMQVWKEISSVLQSLYVNPSNIVQGTTAAMTGTTSTQLLAAPGSNLRNYATSIWCVNSHASVGTFVSVQDGSGGTIIATLAAASVFGGNVVSLPTPLRQPTTNTGLFVADVTTGANVICTAVGYKAA